MTAMDGRAQHAADRDTIIATLRAAGWERTETGELCGSANLVFDNGTLALEVDHTDSRERRSMNLVFIRADGDEVMIHVSFGERLPQVLSAITARQAAIDGERWRDLVDDVLRICPDGVFAYDGDELVPLVAE